MSGDQERLLMFHGTSDVFLGDILSRGLLLFPDKKLSAAMAEGTGHTVSFPGTYLTVEHRLACFYANKAAEHFGGNPVIVGASVDSRNLVPDEDEVHFSLGWPLVDALGYDRSQQPEEQQLAPWSQEAATRAVRHLLRGFGLGDCPEERIEEMAGCLHRMVSPLRDSNTDWLRLLCPEFNEEGWESPVWVRKLTGTAAGMTIYRKEMDLLCRALAGADPDSYPCGFESCKGRVLDPLVVDGPDNVCVVLTIGSKDDPALHYDGFHRLFGNERSERESRWILQAERKMAPA